MANTNKTTAELFGFSLDKDDFETTQSLLAPDCIYDMGSEILKTPQVIVNSYEQNMLAGRAKMDKLEWGQSRIEEINENEFVVNFTDYLFHKGQQYTHRCQQKLIINAVGKIEKIIHIHDQEESDRLKAWYQSVGIPTQ